MTYDAVMQLGFSFLLGMLGGFGSHWLINKHNDQALTNTLIGHARRNQGLRDILTLLHEDTSHGLIMPYLGNYIKGFGSGVVINPSTSEQHNAVMLLLSLGVLKEFTRRPHTTDGEPALPPHFTIDCFVDAAHHKRIEAVLKRI